MPRIEAMLSADMRRRIESSVAQWSKAGPVVLAELMALASIIVFVLLADLPWLALAGMAAALLAYVVLTRGISARIRSYTDELLLFEHRRLERSFARRAMQGVTALGAAGLLLVVIEAVTG